MLHSYYLKTTCYLLISQKLRYQLLKSFSNKANYYDLVPRAKEPLISNLLNGLIFPDISNKKLVKISYSTTNIRILNEISKNPKINPSDTSVILFPGQGIIKVGDIKNYIKFPRVKELFEIANEILGFNLLQICLKGPQNILDRTEYNQPATVVMSLAALEKLQDERPKAIESCIAIAGYSIGELTGLIFSGAMTYEDGLRLIAVRATAMQNASEMSSQGMIFCYCSPSAKTSLICSLAEKWATDIGASNPVCRIAIYLHTQGRIFGGCNEALEYIQTNSSTLGVRNVQRLPVSGGFHTILMQPALKSFIKTLNKTPLREPNTFLYSNFNAKTYSDNEKRSKKYLMLQIISPVKWEQIIQKIYSRSVDINFPRTFDVGSRGTMKTILKMINAKAAKNCYVY